MNSVERLDGDMGVSADGLGEGLSEEVRTINEFRVVAVLPGDAVIIGRPLVRVGPVLGDNDDVAGRGEGPGEIGHSRVARGALALLDLEIDTLESEKGEFCTEGINWCRRGKELKGLLSSSGCSVIVLIACAAMSDNPRREHHGEHGMDFAVD